MWWQVSHNHPDPSLRDLNLSGGNVARAHGCGDGVAFCRVAQVAGHEGRHERATGMKIERRFTTPAGGAYGDIAFTTTTSEIRNPDGTVVFRNDQVEVPQGWSQVASDVIAQKYFRKAGVPAALKRVKEKGVPEFLWRSVPDEAALAKLSPHLPGATGPWTAGAHLPGGDFPVDGAGALTDALMRDHPFLTPGWANRLVRAYGTEAAQVLDGAKAAADLGRDFGATLTESELRWMINREWARDAAGVLWRRSKLGLRLSPEQVAAVEDYIASERVAA